MPDKHGKSRHSRQIRKWKEKQRLLVATHSPVAAPGANPAPMVAKVTPKANIAVPSAAPSSTHHSYIGAELLRIVILTGIILLILFVLFFVSH